LLSFSLFLLELIHLVHVALSAEVDILSSNTRLFVELHIHSWLVSNQNWCFHVEMENHDQLVSGTRLIEQVFDIGEDDVDFLSFS